ncbi:MAG: TetR/AcrR family transcriptional regulator [Gemmatimonadales bacterium]
MGSRERRDRERAETRERILVAAREMFVRKGYEATTMRAIAERVEYTPTAIYHHFRNKEALLTELAATDFRALAQAFNRIGQVADPIERLRKIGEAYVEFAVTHPMQYQLMFMAQRPRPRNGLPHDDPSESAYAFLRQTCAEAIKTGRLRPEFGDPDELAQICWSSTHGLVSLHIVKGHDKGIGWRDVGKTARRAVDTLIRGMLGNPEA